MTRKRKELKELIEEWESEIARLKKLVAAAHLILNYVPRESNQVLCENSIIINDCGQTSVINESEPKVIQNVEAIHGGHG